MRGQGLEKAQEQQFQAQIHSVCEEKLQAIAADGEEKIYRSGNLGSVLGNLGEQYWGAKIRMDGWLLNIKIFIVTFNRRIIIPLY